MKPSSIQRSATPTSSTTLRSFKLRLLKMLLAFGTCAIVVIWFSEASSLRINPFDQVAYPILVTLFVVYFATIQLWPATLPVVELLSFATLASYIVVYLQIIIYSLQPAMDMYTLATFAQWFPLVYAAAFIFLETRSAIAICVLIYLSLLFPTLLNSLTYTTLFMESDMYAVLLNMNFSHPIYIVALSGIAQLKEHLIRMKAYAETMSIAASIDHLTGITNRRATAQALQYALDQAQAAGWDLAVILLDVDNFKRINDTFGHDAGDQVLIDIAGFMRQQMRAADTLGRWGGEEFMIIAPNTDVAAAGQLAERLRVAIGERPDRQVGRVTVSFGVATLALGDTPESLVKRADKALYRAKQQGRDRVEIAAAVISGYS